MLVEFTGRPEANLLIGDGESAPEFDGSSAKLSPEKTAQQPNRGGSRTGVAMVATRCNDPPALVSADICVAMRSWGRTLQSKRWLS